MEPRAGITEELDPLACGALALVVLALDADTAGQAAMVRALEALPTGESETAPVAGRDLVFFEKRLSVNISVLALPVGKDPDEMIRADPESWPGVVASAQPFLGSTEA